MKTNRDKNTEHASKQTVRPKEKAYDFKPLEEVIRQWALIK